MTSIGSWLWGSTQLDEQVDKATSELMPVGSEDIALNLDITDQIRSKAVPAKDAMRSLKRRLNHKNPNVQLLALSLTDTCVKNGGDHFLAEIASREFLDNLVAILRSPATNRDVHTRALRLIQNWALAFGSRHPFTYAGQVYADLKREGVTFPPEDLTTSSSAMVDTKAPPEWLDSDTCLYCRDPFTFTNRKHHCRNCGRVVDAKCSSHTLPLPHFGITQEVRVCEICWKDLGGKYRSGAGAGAGAGAGGVDPRRVSTHGHGHAHGQSRRARADDDADLQRAIRLSLEQTYGGSTARYGASHYVPSSAPAYTGSEPPLVAPRHSTPSSTPSSNPIADDEDDPELKAAIEASLREANAPRPSAPIADGDDDDGRSTPRPYQSAPPVDPNDLSALESDTILTFSQTVEQLSTSTGASRDLARYPAVTQLLDRATALRPRMAVALDDAGRKEAVLADMNEKLAAAVRMYDRILTEQVARPRGYYHHQQQQQQQQGPYGMAQGTMAYQHAPYQQQYAPGPSYQPAYAQPQSPPPPVRQTTHPVPSSSPVQGLQRSNTLPYHPQYAPQLEQQQQQQQYSAPPQQQQQQQYAAPSQQQYASPGPSAPPGLYAPPTPAPAPAPSQPQYATAPPPQSSAPTPAPTYQTQIQTQPSFQHASPPSSATSQTQFAPPTPAPGPVSAGVYQPQYASAPAPSAPTPVQVQPVAPQPAQPYTAPPPVQSYVSPPPAQHQQQQYAPPSSTQQQQQQYASPPPNQGQPYHPMPSFPVVPSNPPTTFNLQERSAFADPVPVKEASLIEL